MKDLMTTTERPVRAGIYPCDRCGRVRPVYPNRPGELLCERCRDAALAVEAAERNRR